ncbi:AraC family transcriptional regulator [Flavobacterium sp. 245]|uniref:AraC family transcriptional regulator n=1 Tax=Flavobacterium sp. 245 TaxID=2512115 RepID=UPI00105E9E3A|nr:AraC family transcriptional regulator [Flavobacterium sp. 245]TDO96061.1 AraC-like DNA-binding protein [Flavobacterium sp. 245]
MLKDLINSEVNKLPFLGAAVHRVKKYIAETPADEKIHLHYPAALLMKSGRFKIRTGQIVLDLEPYDLIILPEKLLCTQMEAGDKLQFFLIIFSSAKQLHGLKYNKESTLFYLYGNRPVKVSLDSIDYLVLSLICRLIYAEGQNRPAGDFELELQRLSFDLLFFELKYIYSRYVASSGLHVSKAEALAARFLTVLSIHCRKHHNVKFYAGALYVAPEYLNRAVKEAVGKTAKKMITEAVLAEALQMLEDSNYSIAEIAEELEFSSSTSFGIFFKKWMSCTPSKFRSNAADKFKSR